MFLKNQFPELVRQAIPDDVSLDQVEVWFQDETRIGQQGSLSRLWAKRGTRPRVVRQQQFLCQYLFGAVCPETGACAAIIAPCVNSSTMQLHLEEISFHVPAGKHAVLLMDRAGWHTNQCLELPGNISILYFPPYSPELNPQESVWQVIKDQFLKNRVYQSSEEILEAASHAWTQWTQNTLAISSLCSRQWAVL